MLCIWQKNQKRGKTETWGRVAWKNPTFNLTKSVCRAACGVMNKRRYECARREKWDTEAAVDHIMSRRRHLVWEEKKDKSLGAQRCFSQEQWTKLHQQVGTVSTEYEWEWHYFQRSEIHKQLQCKDALKKNPWAVGKKVCHGLWGLGVI